MNCAYSQNNKNCKSIMQYYIKTTIRIERDKNTTRSSNTLQLFSLQIK